MCPLLSIVGPRFWMPPSDGLGEQATQEVCTDLTSRLIDATRCLLDRARNSQDPALATLQRDCGSTLRALRNNREDLGSRLPLGVDFTIT